MRLESLELWDRPSKKPRKIVEATDGVQYERATGAGEESIRRWEQGRNVVGHIQPLDALSRFHDSYNPLVLQGAIDPTVRFEMPGDPLTERLERLWVFERPAACGHARVVAMGGVHRKLMLSLRRGMAIQSKLLYRYDHSEPSGRVVKDPTYVTQRGEGWFEEGGYWLPKRIIRVSHRADDNTETAVVVVNDVAINEPIDDDVFSKVIPSGALVTRPGVKKAYRLER